MIELIEVIDLTDLAEMNGMIGTKEKKVQIEVSITASISLSRASSTLKTCSLKTLLPISTRRTLESRIVNGAISKWSKIRKTSFRRNWMTGWCVSPQSNDTKLEKRREKSNEKRSVLIWSRKTRSSMKWSRSANGKETSKTTRGVKKRKRGSVTGRRKMI